MYIILTPVIIILALYNLIQNTIVIKNIIRKVTI